MKRATWTTGGRLHHEARKDALRKFVHRHTRDHVFAGSPFQDISDDQWLSEHAFAVKADGTLDNRHSHCGPAYFDQRGASQRLKIRRRSHNHG